MGHTTPGAPQLPGLTSHAAGPELKGSPGYVWVPGGHCGPLSMSGPRYSCL